MIIYGADTVFDTLHETLYKIQTHKTLQEIYKTYKTRHSTIKPQYSSCSSHQINMADCTTKMNWELTLLKNVIVEPTKSTTSIAWTSIEYTINAIRTSNQKHY